MGQKSQEVEGKDYDGDVPRRAAIDRRRASQ